MKVLAIASAAGLIALAVTAAGESSASTAPAAAATVTYHGCIKDTGRTISRVFVLRTPTCPADSFPATWDAQGPKGATGARGPAGPAGVVDLYDSTTPEGILNQTAGVLTMIGNAVNLAPNPTGADLGTVNVGLVICSGGVQ